MWFAPKRSSAEQKQPKRFFRYGGPSPAAAVPGCLARPCLAQLDEADARRALRAQVWWEEPGGSASAPLLGRTRPTARPGLSSLVGRSRFPFPARSPAGPQPTSHFLIARKWQIPAGLVSMAHGWIPRLWPLPSFSWAGCSSAFGSSLWNSLSGRTSCSSHHAGFPPL